MHVTHACQYLGVLLSVVQDMYRYTWHDSLVRNVKSLTFRKSSSSPIQSLTPDHPQSTCHVSPSSLSPRPLTLQLWMGFFFFARGSNSSKRDGWGWQTHRSMLFPSFEIAIRADLIKPACIIEVFQERLTGSRYLRTSAARSTGNFGGVATETFARNVNQAPASCVSHECMQEIMLHVSELCVHSF